ncbi:MAG: efflux RND transporter periplasmic adaptor subunit [Bacillota bacterium]
MMTWKEFGFTRKKIFVLIITAVIVAAGIITGIVLSMNKHVSPSTTTNHQPLTTGSTAQTTEQPLLIVDIPLEKQQQIGVTYAAATSRALDYPLRSVARVSIDEQSLFIVSTRYSGFVEQLFAAETGQYIAAGQPVAAIYSPELLAAQNEYITVLSNPAVANLRTAARERLSLLGVDDAFINNLEHTQQAQRTVTVTSPSGGYVMQRQVLPGSQVLAGQPILTVADLSRVWVIADIYEQDLALVHAGQPVSLTFSAFPDTKINSKIDYIYPMLDAQTRTAKVRMTVANPDGKFKPQMYGAITINISLAAALTVPDSAVLNTGNRKIVYVDLGDGKLQQRLVTTGYSANGYSQITSGLKVNERVTTAANFLIDAETRLHGEVAP